jgi:hypothetical protein
MKTLVTIAAATILLTGQAVANPEFDNHDNYGTILQDLDRTVSNGSDYAPTGYLVGVADSSDSYGSILYDLDRPAGPSIATPPSIGDDADDFGNILYDTGSIY